MFERVPSDDLHDGDVRSGQEPDQPHHADGHVLHHDQRRQALRVKSQELQDGREDESQEAAADRAHQRNDQVQLRDEDGQGAWRTGGGQKQVTEESLDKTGRVDQEHKAGINWEETKQAERSIKYCNY